MIFVLFCVIIIVVLLLTKGLNLMLENLKPQKVFRYFEEISAIPHGSGNVEAIGDYCMKFAENHKLKAVKEPCGNVIIYADGTAGHENSEPVILQGHLDMVCEKSNDCIKDMEKDAITLCTDGEWVWADGTTLGGDDGIAIAYVLAILDSDDIPHPPLEILLTVDEETGMTGAENLDGSNFKGKKLINIDSEEEGFITVSCAGGVRCGCEYEMEFTDTEEGMCAVEIEVDKLLGGHSGVEINKRRLNGHKVLAEVLNYAYKQAEFFICDIKGGNKTNVIPKSACAVVVTKAENKEKLINSASEYFREIFWNENGSFEAEAELCACESYEAVPAKHMTAASTRKTIFALLNSPDGVVTVMKNDPDMVKSSLNMGELYIDNNSVKMGYLIRSNSLSGKKAIMEKLRSFTEYLGGKAVFDSDYPSWEYREDSPLRDIMVEAFKEMYGREPVITSIHAGLECGLLSEKITDGDMVSIGPDLENVHTPDERMNVASVERTWNYLLSVLKKLK